MSLFSFVCNPPVPSPPVRERLGVGGLESGHGVRRRVGDSSSTCVRVYPKDFLSKVLHSRVNPLGLFTQEVDLLLSELKAFAATH